jgi:hypothetical protein
MLSSVITVSGTTNFFLAILDFIDYHLSEKQRRIDHLGLLDHRIKALEIMKLLPSGLPHGFNLYYDVLRFVD